MPRVRLAVREQFASRQTRSRTEQGARPDQCAPHTHSRRAREYYGFREHTKRKTRWLCVASDILTFRGCWRFDTHLKDASPNSSTSEDSQCCLLECVPKTIVKRCASGGCCRSGCNLSCAPRSRRSPGQKRLRPGICSTCFRKADPSPCYIANALRAEVRANGNASRGCHSRCERGNDGNVSDQQTTM